MKIKNLEIKSNTPLYMAPMAGVTDLTFRGICTKLGADITCTEMVSAKALSYKNKNTAELLKKSSDEKIVAVQLFGSEPEIMAEEAKKIEESFDIIDVNMGCPVPKIVNNGEGSALMKNPKLAEKIVSAMAKKLDKPLTVKFRLGFDEEHINAAEFAKMLEGAGASAITLHARTRKQMYEGKADWNAIADVVSAVKIPVFGNGDVFIAEDALKMKNETGVAGIMIARGAMGNPWIFKNAKAILDGEDLCEVPSNQEKKRIILAHAKGLIEDKGQYTGIREMRKQLAWYTSGMKGSAGFRAKTNYIESYDELIKSVEEFFGG